MESTESNRPDDRHAAARGRPEVTSGSPPSGDRTTRTDLDVGLGKLLLRLLLLLAGAFAIWSVAMAFADPADGYDVATHLLQGLGITLASLALVYLLLRLDALGWRDIGFSTFTGNARAFAFGLGVWLLPAAIGVAACVLMGWADIVPLAGASDILARTALLAVAVLLVEALPEEVLFRGYAQSILQRRFAPWAALLLQALMFWLFAWAIGAMDSPQQWHFLLSYALILGFVRVVFDSVWAGIGVHAGWMTTAQLLGSQALFTVEGMATLQFVAFALLPSITIGVLSGWLRPGMRWTAKPERRPAQVSQHTSFDTETHR